MPNYNNVVLIGHLTRDPELRFVGSGLALCKCGIGVTNRYKSKSGEQKERKLFIDFTVWGKPAEWMNEGCKKGTAVTLIGELQLEQWDGKDGQRRSKHSLIVQTWTHAGRSGTPSGPPEIDESGFDEPMAQETKLAEGQDIPF